MIGTPEQIATAIFFREWREADAENYQHDLGIRGEAAVFAHFLRVTKTFAGITAENIISEQDAVDYIEAAIMTSRAQLSGNLSDAAMWSILDRCIYEFDRILSAPGLTAELCIRNAVKPLMHARKPRAELLIAAYRAANGRLSAQDVEHIVSEEITAFMARVRAAKGFRHAG